MAEAAKAGQSARAHPQPLPQAGGEYGNAPSPIPLAGGAARLAIAQRALVAAGWACRPSAARAHHRSLPHAGGGND